MRLEKKQPTEKNKKLEADRPKKEINHLFILLAITTLTIPLLFLPITADPIEFNKQIFFIIATLLLMVLWSIRMVKEKKVSIISNQLDVAMLIFLTGNLITAATSTNLLISATTPRTWVWILLPIFFWAALNNLKTRKEISNIENLILLSGALLSIWTVIQYFTDISLTINSLPSGLSPIGNSKILATYLVTIAVMSATKGCNLSREQSKNQKNRKGKRIIALSSLAAIALTASFLVSPLTSDLAERVTGIYVEKQPQLPASTAWNIASSALERRPVRGVGNSLYETGFNRFRTVAYNQTDNWNLTFNTASNLWFHILTEGGLIGLVGLGTLFALTGRFIWKTSYTGRLSLTWTDTAIISLALLSIFNVWTTPIAFLFFLLLALKVKDNFLKKPDPEQEMQISVLAIPTIMLNQKKGSAINTLSEKKGAELLPKIIVIPAVIFAVFGFYTTARAYIADVTFKESIDATLQNEGRVAYEKQTKAVNYNPYNTDYRLTYSQLNYLIALNISSRKDVGEKEIQLVRTLVEQSIRNGKAATTLYPQNSRTWFNLANIYNKLINYANEADQWAIDAYNAAIARNPTDPQIRIAKGEVYAKTGQYQQAVQSYIEAANLKPDLASTYYNIALTLVKMGNIEQAKAFYQKSLTLLEKESKEYTQVQQQLDLVKEGKIETLIGETEAAKPTDETSTDYDTQEKDLNVELGDLDEELAPEATESATPQEQETEPTEQPDEQ